MKWIMSDFPILSENGGMETIRSFSCSNCHYVVPSIHSVCPGCGEMLDDGAESAVTWGVIRAKDAKDDGGKLDLTLVPTSVVRAIGRVRRYGTEKYGDPDNWRTVEPERYRAALYRHWLAYLDDPHGVDEESGLPHLWHVACNAGFLIDLEEDFQKKG